MTYSLSLSHDVYAWYYFCRSTHFSGTNQRPTSQVSRSRTVYLPDRWHPIANGQVHERWETSDRYLQIQGEITVGSSLSDRGSVTVLCVIGVQLLILPPFNQLWQFILVMLNATMVWKEKFWREGPGLSSVSVDWIQWRRLRQMGHGEPATSHPSFGRCS